MKRLMAITAAGGILIAACLGLYGAGQPGEAVPIADGYKRAAEVIPFDFPRDHGAHPDYAIEWWYFTGSLTAENGDQYGYFLTFFRVGIDPDTSDRKSAWAASDILFAHASITDVRNGKFVYEQKLARPVLNLGGYSSEKLEITVDRWKIFTEISGNFHLGASLNRNFGLSLKLRSLKDPVLNGDRGLSRKGKEPGNANYYYSVTRLQTEGHLTIDGRDVAVKGTSWMDREWGTSHLDPNSQGWDWFSLRLSDGRDLMIYVLRGKDGRPTEFSSGTLVSEDGRSVITLKPGDFRIKIKSRWKSPRTGGIYPSSWDIEVPSHELMLSVLPAVPDQELTTEGTAGVTYWEGLALAEGTSRGKAVTAEGYIELTGYAVQSQRGRLPQ